ncbi:hypothetical protein F5Y15DRAFT_396191 [Xylariaceae sp. FL0016]|nr:hypothetical protein F5Y15DRAFT_396191 [Xylariaceae sp. FL0016]
MMQRSHQILWGPRYQAKIRTCSRNQVYFFLFLLLLWALHALPNPVDVTDRARRARARKRGGKVLASAMTYGGGPMEENPLRLQERLRSGLYRDNIEGGVRHARQH